MRTVNPDTTFLLQSQVPVQATTRESLFGKHMLRPADRQIIIRKEFQPGWIFGILIGTTLILAWLLFLYRKRLIQLVYSGFSKRNLSQLIRDGDPFKERITLALSMVYVMMIALLFLQTNMLLIGIKLPNVPDILFYLILVLIISIFWVAKIFLMSVLKTIFRTDSTHYEYTLNILIFNSITGIMLLPALIFAIYLKSAVVLYISYSLLGLLFIIRFMKGFLIGISLTRFSYLFLFVYLCGLELIPLVILTKVLIRYIIPVF